MDCQNRTGLGGRADLRGKTGGVLGWLILFVYSLDISICSLVLYKEMTVLSVLTVLRIPAGASNGSWHRKA